MEKETYYLMTDGAARGFGNNKNKKCGSIGGVILNEDKEELLKISKPFKEVTNNMCELMASLTSILALYKALNRNGVMNSKEYHFVLGSDSKQLLQAIEEWMPNWKRRNWRKGDGSLPKNLELYKFLDQLLNKYPNVKFSTHWTRGHLTKNDSEYDPFYSYYNIMCDGLADEALTNNPYEEYGDFAETFERMKKFYKTL